MHRHCEICGSVGPSAAEASGKKLRRVLLGERIVMLCDPHASRARSEDVSSVEALRALFREANGQRSRLDRRSPLDRRVFPARPEGRRGNSGRRAQD
jgi:hypothetical protein